MVFLKQYGERRTGTNYLRALLQAHYSNVVTLMHMLGDKHSQPVALDELWEKVRDEPDAAWKLVSEATFAASAQTTRPEDPDQLAYMRSLADPVAAAVASGSLAFALSTKHPFPWITSLAKFHGWLVPMRGGMRMHPVYTGHLMNACKLYNTRHQVWLDHVVRYRSRSAIVRHEDLLSDFRSVLNTLASQFGLQRATPELKDLEFSVAAPFWDQRPIGFRQMPFDPEFYTNRDYLARMNQDVWDIVTGLIDWNLVGRLGYLVDGSTSPDWSFSSQIHASS